MKYILFVNGELFFLIGKCQRPGQGTIMVWSEKDDTYYQMASSVCETNCFLKIPDYDM